MKIDTMNEVFKMIEQAKEYSLESEVMLSFIYAIRQQETVKKAVTFALSEWDIL